MALIQVLKEATKKTTEEVVPEVAEELAPKAIKEATEEAVKQPKRKAPKRQKLGGVPEEEVIQTRKADIIREQQRAAIESKEITQQVDEQIDLNIYKEQDPEYAALLERQRNVYEKALSLKKEREAVELLEKEDNVYNGIYDQMSTELGVGKAHSSIESRGVAIYKRVSQEITDLKEALRTKVLGIKQDVELAHEVIRYLKDGDVKNPKLKDQAIKIAEQWRKASTMMKTMRNKAGGRIGTLSDWVIPQSHDAVKIKKAGYETWSESIKPKLDVARIEAEQGRSIDEVLQIAFKNITTREAEVPAPGATSKLSRKHEEQRVLHFSDGDGIIAYNKDFGNPDVFGTMDGFLQQQSREIAMLQLWGPNPENTFNKLLEIGRAKGLSAFEETKLQAQFNVSSGRVDHNNIVEVADHRIANFSGTYRALQVASKLGTSLVAALADAGNIFLGAYYRKLNGFKIFGRGLSIMLQEAIGTGASKDILLASRIGVVSEFAQASIANSRFAEHAAGKMQNVASGVIRASGLSAWTDALRGAFGLELAGNLADYMGKNFNDIPFNKMLTEYGITEGDWKVISLVPKKIIDGAEFIDIAAIHEVSPELGFKVGEMIQQEMNAFVVMPTDRVRVYTTWGKQKGTALGETSRNMALFKSFTISITMLHMNRLGKLSGMDYASYAGAVVLSGMVFGQISLWVHDIVTGKSPRSLNRAVAPLEAILKSGGLGIFGDFFLGQDKTRYGHSWTSSAIGVPATTIEDMGKTLMDIATLNEKAPANIYNRAKSYIPGQNLWYTRYLMQQSVGRAMGELIDPDFEKKKRRRRKALRTRGQKEYDLF